MSLKIKVLELSKLALVLFTLFNYIFTTPELKDKEEKEIKTKKSLKYERRY